MNRINGHSRWIEVGFDEILDRWLEPLPEAIDRFNVYVHGPFCVELCQFCMHQGLPVSGHRDATQRYYEDYLPQRIHDHTMALRCRPITAIYFGGGTADVMTAEQMDLVFGAFPDFAAIPCKVFEAHPASLNDAKIQRLASYGFQGGYVSFGLQTFDPNVTAAQHRIHVGEERLAKKVRALQGNGIHVNVDLLAFVNGYEAEHLELLARDLDTLAAQVNPETITVYPLRQAYNLANVLTQWDKPTAEQEVVLMQRRRHLATHLREVVFAFIDHNPAYRLWNWSLDDVMDDDFLTEQCKHPLYVTRASEQEMARARQYDSGTPPFQKTNHSVLSIGGFGRAYASSYIGDEYAYYFQNVAWADKYYVVHDVRRADINLNQLGWEALHY